MKEIFNYLQLTEKLSSSGMPTPEQLREIAEAGHAVHLEQPAAFIGVAREFLGRAGQPAHYIESIPVEETAS